MKVIALDELVALQSANPALTCVDVRLEEDFTAQHLPGAKNATVFKVSFIDDLRSLGGPVSDPLVVYGAGTDSHESRLAAEKLERAGWTDVMDFRPGLEAWVAAGRPTEGEGRTPDPERPDGRFAVDLEATRVEWLGRNLLNKHYGTVGVQSGHIICQQGQLVGGEFTLDMRSIRCADITDPSINRVLIDHLKSDDFFDVERHPEARFVIDRVEPISGASRGVPDLRIGGELELRGERHPCTLEATSGLNDKGRFCCQATVVLDRTNWGSIYGSGRFFQNVGMHLVNDLVEIQVRLAT